MNKMDIYFIFLGIGYLVLGVLLDFPTIILSFVVGFILAVLIDIWRRE